MEFLVLAILIFFNGFFALSEIAVVSSSRAKLEELATRGKARARMVLGLQEDSENFLSAVQVGITLIGILTGVYSGANLADDLIPFFEKIGWLKVYADKLALSTTIIIITYFSIVVGELIPKTFALSHPERIAVLIAPIMKVFSIVLYPFVFLLSKSTSIFNKLMGIRKNTETVSSSELRHMIRIAKNEGVIASDQSMIHDKLFSFTSKMARHIMTHRVDVEWIDISDTQSVEEKLKWVKHSKVLVCDGEVDRIVGVLSVTRLLSQMTSGQAVDLKKILIAPQYVPENCSAQKILQTFRKQHHRFVIVINEYGGFEGIITLHDVVESIMGDFPEDHDDIPDVIRNDDESVLVAGGASIEVLAEVMGELGNEKEHLDYSTVAGFVFHHTKMIPTVGDTFEYHNFRFEITQINTRKIEQVKLMRLG